MGSSCWSPLFYNGSTIRVEVHPEYQPISYEHHGRVWSFLLAAAITSWGLLGSLSVAFAAILELEFAGSLTLLVSLVLVIVLAGSLLFFLRYLWVSVGGTIQDQLDPTAQAARKTRILWGGTRPVPPPQGRRGGRGQPSQPPGRRNHGKSDPLDAVEAARAVISGRALGSGKTKDGPVEAIRVLVLAKRSARQARVKAIVQMRHLGITTPDQLHSRLKGLTVTALVAE